MKLSIAILLCFCALLLGSRLTYLVMKQKERVLRTFSFAQNKPNKKRRKLGTMDWILVLIGLFLVIFTTYMVILFREYGMIPDTLVSCVFATLAGECGIMGWIKTSKERNKERKWEKEDREYYDRPQDPNKEE